MRPVQDKGFGGFRVHPDPAEGAPVTDATVFLEGGLWWLFCTHPGSAELYVYHAETLQGEWTAHALNPVKRDVSSSRPAGTPYRRRGGLYRPAQDCSTTYGGAVAINRILELAPDRFREEVVYRIGPEWPGKYPDGFHTLNVLDGACVVDGKRIGDRLVLVLQRLGLRRAFARPA